MVKDTKNERLEFCMGVEEYFRCQVNTEKEGKPDVSDEEKTNQRQNEHGTSFSGVINYDFSDDNGARKDTTVTFSAAKKIADAHFKRPVDEVEMNDQEETIQYIHNLEKTCNATSKIDGQYQQLKQSFRRFGKEDEYIVLQDIQLIMNTMGEYLQNINNLKSDLHHHLKKQQYPKTKKRLGVSSNHTVGINERLILFKSSILSSAMLTFLGIVLAMAGVPTKYKPLQFCYISRIILSLIPTKTDMVLDRIMNIMNNSSNMSTNQSITDNERDYRDGKHVLQINNDAQPDQLHRPNKNESKGEKVKKADESMSKNKRKHEDGDIHQMNNAAGSDQLHRPDIKESEEEKVKKADQSILEREGEQKDGNIPQRNKDTRADQLHMPDINEPEEENAPMNATSKPEKECSSSGYSSNGVSETDSKSNGQDIGRKQQNENKSKLQKCKKQRALSRSYQDMDGFGKPRSRFDLKAPAASSQPECDPGYSPSYESEHENDSKRGIDNSRRKQHECEKGDPDSVSECKSDDVPQSYLQQSTGKQPKEKKENKKQSATRKKVRADPLVNLKSEQTKAAAANSHPEGAPGYSTSGNATGNKDVSNNDDPNSSRNRHVKKASKPCSQPGGDPDDSSNSSSDTEGDDVPKSDLQPSSGKKSKHKKDSVRSWRACLNDEDNEKMNNTAHNLIKSRTWPNGEILNEAYNNKTLSRDTLKFICKHVCAHLQNKSSKIKSIWAGSRRAEVVLVIITEHDNDRCPHLDEYTVEYRGINTYSDEGKDIAYCEENTSYNPEEKDTQRISECLNKETSNLMDKHSNISIVSSDFVKSKNYGQQDAQRLQEPCIVLYVHIKGIIPIGENAFPKRLHELLVDVREGGFMWCGSTAKDIQQTLTMGSQISGNRCVGSIGAILEHKYNKKQFFITSGHVLLTDEKFEQLSTISNGYVEYDCNTPDRDVFQPFPPNDYCVGHLHGALYRKGGYGTAGMEIAIVEINKRHPEHGRFPDFFIEGETEPVMNLLTYTTGEKITSMKDLQDRIKTGAYTLIKIGSQTGITVGETVMQGMAVKQSSSLKMSGPTKTVKDLIIELHNQIELKSTVQFSDIGDSGSLVFLQHRAGFSHELGPFGILTGKTSYGTYSVTPIWDILQSLPELRLRTFAGLPNRLGELCKLYCIYKSLYLL